MCATGVEFSAHDVLAKRVVSSGLADNPAREQNPVASKTFQEQLRASAHRGVEWGRVGWSGVGWGGVGWGGVK